MNVMRRRCSLAFVGVFLWAVAASEGQEPWSYQVSAPTIKASTSKHMKLTTALAELASIRHTEGLPAARDFAGRHRITLVDDNVRVVIKCEVGAVESVKRRIVALGGTFGMTAGERVLAGVPLVELGTLALDADVLLIRQPVKLVPFEVTSQGVSVIGAPAWHDVGTKGSGVKVAILDVGFQGYQGLLGSELPQIPADHVRSFAGDITGGGESHGTAVAEIVHDVAPEAELYLVNASDDVQLENAVDWLIDQHVNVINASWGVPCDGSLDGTGQTNELVRRAEEAEILWVNAAGNFAERHWSGTFSDTNDNSWHNFSGTEDGNTIYMNYGDDLRVCVAWDDWADRDQDYDLYVWNEDGSIVASSGDPQNGSSSNEPVERLEFTAYADGFYFIGIKKYRAEHDARFQLFAYPEGSECAIESVATRAGESGGQLATLREFHDLVLGSSEIGRELVRAYYRHSPEVRRLFLLHPGLALDAAGLIAESGPTVRSVLAARKGDLAGPDVVISHDYLGRIEHFLGQLESLASPALHEDLAVLQERFALGTAVGQTATEFVDSLLGRPPFKFAETLAAYPEAGYMRYTKQATSLVPPADSPHALTVGATNWSTDLVEEFSSQGPTADGRLKPDVTAPDGVCTTTYDDCGGAGFLGTSASAPHAAGAAALVIQQFPALPPADVREFLEARAADIAPTGPDTVSGAGRLWLGPVGNERVPRVARRQLPRLGRGAWDTLNLSWPLDAGPNALSVGFGFGADWECPKCTTCEGLPKKHVGVDLGAGVGDTVYAAEAGKAHIHDLGKEWGKAVVLEHVGGFTTSYLHVDPLVEEGEQVGPGQPIATVANIDGYHLHFGVRLKPYDQHLSVRGALPQTRSQDKDDDPTCASDPLFADGGFANPYRFFATTVDSGQQVSGISGVGGSWTYYKILVPPGQDLLEVKTWGGSGDADLYVKLGEAPASGFYDFESHATETTEAVRVTRPSAGTWFVGVRALSEVSGVSLSAEWR